MFTEDFRRRSDGARIGFHCSDRASKALALSLVRSAHDAPPVERTSVVDAGGRKIGERLVWNSRGYAEVTWNESARLFAIAAQSLKDALAFEKSQTWESTPVGCWDARSWP